MAAAPRTPSSRTLAQGPDWAVWEVNCTLGPHDRPFEERHEYASIAAVLRGTFHYRSTHGSELLYPGSFLLGNAGACFECGHEHGTGDHCIAFGFAPSLFEEIAATVAGASRYRFRLPRLPASFATTPAVAAVEASARHEGAPLRASCEELAIALAERVIRTTSAYIPRAAKASLRDVRRVTDAVRYIDEHHREPLDLARLAGIAHMSKYHFLRTFRKVVAATPHQYLLTVRLWRSAARLAAREDSIATIASDAGFGDLSTFYAHFRQAFGYPPTGHRRTMGEEAAWRSDAARGVTG